MSIAVAFNGRMVFATRSEADIFRPLEALVVMGCATAFSFLYTFKSGEGVGRIVPGIW